MRGLLILALITVSGLCSAQGLLEFRNDLAFDPNLVNVTAERAYRERLKAYGQDGRLDADAALLARLERVVAQLRRAAHFERPEASSIAWEVHVCRRCGENASAMAGGKLLVGEEFISELALTDDELGYVLAHEMAHVLAEHTREFATTARSFVGNGWNRDYLDIQHELNENLVVNLRMRPVYVQQELEADYIGFVLGARGGFNPEAMITMLGKLRGVGGSFLAMHPNDIVRVERMRAMLPAARRIASGSAAAR